MVHVAADIKTLNRLIHQSVTEFRSCAYQLSILCVCGMLISVTLQTHYDTLCLLSKIQIESFFCHRNHQHGCDVVPYDRQQALYSLCHSLIWQCLGILHNKKNSDIVKCQTYFVRIICIMTIIITLLSDQGLIYLPINTTMYCTPIWLQLVITVEVPHKVWSLHTNKPIKVTTHDP